MICRDLKILVRSSSDSPNVNGSATGCVFSCLSLVLGTSEFMLLFTLGDFEHPRFVFVAA